MALDGGEDLSGCLSEAAGVVKSVSKSSKNSLTCMIRSTFPIHIIFHLVIAACV